MDAGSDMFSETDVLVIGGGPAGSAAAITAASVGLGVVLMEGSEFPRPRPGETLHPGVEVIFQQLGVARKIDAASVNRPSGVNVSWAGQSSFQPYGGDKSGPWHGYLISRDSLDSILIDHAKILGVEVLQPCRAGKAIFKNGQVIGVSTSIGDVGARIVIDAGGAQCWSHKQGIVSRHRFSQRLLARYGSFNLPQYSVNDTPRLISEQDHWSWLAPLSPNVINCTQLIFPNTNMRSVAYPNELQGLETIDPMRGVNVTWSLACPSAVNGVIAVGDAARVHDPLSSHGILHALVSGTMAARIAEANVVERTPLSAISQQYDEWTKEYFLSTSAQLISHYQELNLDFDWIDDTAKRLMELG